MFTIFQTWECPEESRVQCTSMYIKKENSRNNGKLADAKGMRRG